MEPEGAEMGAQCAKKLPEQAEASGAGSVGLNAWGEKGFEKRPAGATGGYPSGRVGAQKRGKHSLYPLVLEGNPTPQHWSLAEEEQESTLAQGTFLPIEETSIQSLEQEILRIKGEKHKIEETLVTLKKQLEYFEGCKDMWEGEMNTKDETRTQWEIAQLDE